MIHLIKKFINDFNYYPDSDAFTDHYYSHPDYPSLYAVTDTLDFFGIDNVAAKVTSEEFDNLPEKFIALHESENMEQFVYVTQTSKNQVVFIDEKNTIHKQNKESFIQNWKEIIVAIEENKNSITKKSNPTQIHLLSLIIITALILFFNQWLNGFPFTTLLYSILSLIGLAISILITQESFGLSNQISSKICALTESEKAGCKTVLSSKEALIYKDFTLSDASIVFFTTCTFLTVFSVYNLFYFIPISLLSAPLIIYSIYFQKFKIKKWCGLCLCISAVLIGIIVTTLLLNSTYTISQIIVSSSCFSIFLLFFTALWLYIKPILAKYLKLKKSDREHIRFKRNISTFNAILETTKKVDVKSLDLLPKIELGNKNAITELSLFLSPSCGHCHKAFSDGLQLIEKHNHIIKLTVCFNINILNEDNPYKEVVEIIMQNYFDYGSSKALELLKDWHLKRMSLEDFTKEYKIEISEASKSALISHCNWCEENEFNYSPVKLFNKKLFPNEYLLTDLNYFIKEYE